MKRASSEKFVKEDFLKSCRNKQHIIACHIHIFCRTHAKCNHVIVMSLVKKQQPQTQSAISSMEPLWIWMLSSVCDLVCLLSVISCSCSSSSEHLGPQGELYTDIKCYLVEDRTCFSFPHYRPWTGRKSFYFFHHRPQGVMKVKWLETISYEDTLISIRLRLDPDDFYWTRVPFFLM